jgi:hypothetical protein
MSQEEELEFTSCDTQEDLQLSSKQCDEINSPGIHSRKSVPEEKVA